MKKLIVLALSLLSINASPVLGFQTPKSLLMPPLQVSNLAGFRGQYVTAYVVAALSGGLGVSGRLPKSVNYVSGKSEAISVKGATVTVPRFSYVPRAQPIVGEANFHPTYVANMVIFVVHKTPVSPDLIKEYETMVSKGTHEIRYTGIGLVMARGGGLSVATGKDAKEVSFDFESDLN